MQYFINKYIGVNEHLRVIKLDTTGFDDVKIYMLRKEQKELSSHSHSNKVERRYVTSWCSFCTQRIKT